MKVLGLGGSNHDFAACLIVDGVVQGAIEEERLTRIKHSLGLGLKAVRCRSADYLLNHAGLSLDDIDFIVGNDILDPKYYERFKDRIILMNHHLAHASSSYYASGLEKSAVLVVDGYGSPVSQNSDMNETISFYHASGSSIELLSQVSGRINRDREYPVFENSIGAFYLTLTRGLGFEFLQEGKTMGLAAYGSDSRFIREMSEYYRCGDEGEYHFSEEQAAGMAEYIKLQLNGAANDKELFIIKANLAYAGQHHVEKTMVQLSNYLYKRTKLDYLCLAGGVALNSVANYKILSQTPFKQIFIQPAAGDAGTAVGSAMYGHYILGKQQWAPLNEIFSPYLGKEYTSTEVEAALDAFKEKIKVSRPSDLYAKVADLISKGNIIGFFNGRSEIGPRALGNRSILADARHPKMKDIINERIKHREAFRPFAPIVLEEYQTEYVDMDHPSHYMLFVPPIHETKHSVIPAVTHQDGTGRIQTINKKLNPRIHQLLNSFYELTGVPVLLNTSFNDNNEPIVESPMDAVQCFLRIDLDYLVLGDYLLEKQSASL
ncbi:carbamoyltransferase family protein [Paenibacillus hubeiensis]|uniref:carbamoyltransferase family protein n=1 Tax=Paenibacillus hubeiensis TaxID=3077330 RepID=UPI0031BABFEE